jgi:hypothetical protein
MRLKILPDRSSGHFVAPSDFFILGRLNGGLARQTFATEEDAFNEVDNGLSNLLSEAITECMFPQYDSRLFSSRPSCKKPIQQNVMRHPVFSHIDSATSFDEWPLRDQIRGRQEL